MYTIINENRDFNTRNASFYGSYTDACNEYAKIYHAAPGDGKTVLWMLDPFGRIVYLEKF